jgi:hypothetical protein
VSPTQLVVACFPNHDERHVEVRDHVSRTKTTYFLLNGAGHVDIPSGFDAFGHELPYSVDLRGKRAFDVHRAAAPDLAVVYLRAKGWMRPPIGVAYGDVVQVGVEHDRWGVSTPADESDEITRIVDPDLVVAQFFHGLTNHVREWPFVSGKTFCTDQTTYELHTCVDIDHFNPLSVTRYVAKLPSQCPPS